MKRAARGIVLEIVIVQHVDIMGVNALCVGVSLADRNGNTLVISLGEGFKVLLVGAARYFSCYILVKPLLPFFCVMQTSSLSSVIHYLIEAAFTFSKNMQASRSVVITTVVISLIIPALIIGIIHSVIKPFNSAGLSASPTCIVISSSLEA
jgi:hypothetical protein